LILFLDTSVLVKLYIAEPGSERMREAAGQGEPVAVSVLAFAEIPFRGADAVHLASALLLHQEGLEVRFACSDRHLLAAAAAEGLATFNPVSSS
jgi:hypothetical protein